MNSLIQKFIRAAISTLLMTVGVAYAQVDLATSSPTKVYAVVGGAVSFTVSYTQPTPATSDSDLLISYTANTTATPTLTTAIPTGCIDAATPSPYDGAQPNSKYINFTAGLGSFPSAAACGGQTTVAMATFSGTVASFPASGSYVIRVENNNSAGATNVTANDVTVCQKRTVQSVTAPTNFTEGGSGTFTVTLDAAVAVGCGGFSVPFAMSGPAVAGKAATPTSGSCTFADGATSCITTTIATSQNTLIDGDMALTLTVTNSGAADSYVSTGNKAATVTVLDDEVGASVVATTQASETGPTNGVVTFARTGSTAATLNLTSAISGTATYTTDYSITAGTCAIVSQSASTITVTVPAASATCTINIVPVDDALVEGNETVIFGIPTGAAVAGTGTAATITITDNDTPPVFSLTKAGVCAEAVAPTNCSFSITRDSGVTTATTVNFTVAGTATQGTDYTLKTGGCAAGTVLAGTSISHPNASPLVIDVCPIDDLLVETGGETVVFTLTANPPTYTVGTASQTQTIADDDSPQTVSVAVTGSPATEAGGVLTYTFTRAGGSAAALAATLPVNITPPTASTRYSSTCTSPVTFAVSATTATCTVTGVDNAVADGNINVVVAVAAPTVASAYTVGTPASATGVINDNEIGISVAATGATEGSNVSFSITCTGPVASTATVTFAISGQDAGATITPAAGPVTVTCGTPLVVTVSTTNDVVIGNNRAVTLTLSAPVSPAVLVGSASVAAAVADNDQPTSIPTMSAFGLGLMSLMLIGFAAFQRRRYMK